MVKFDLSVYEMENGKLQSYTWPGGYPIFYVTADCGKLCPDCANANRELLSDVNDPQWFVICCDVNYEDVDLTCDNCNKPIEAAYAERAEQ